MSKKIYCGGCDRVIKLIELKIENFKKMFGKSPSFIVVSKDNYNCMVVLASQEVNQSSFPENFQGIPIVLISGHEILNVVGTPRDMLLYQLKELENEL